MTLLAFATQGSGGGEEARLQALLANLGAEFLLFDRGSKWRTFLRIWKAIRRRRPNLVVMEGTGVAGGIPLLLGRLVTGTRYVVSSGDAVGPYLAYRKPLLSPVFHAYERLLYARAAGFIGWTPYLTGRALSFGVPRAMTAPGWAPFPTPAPLLAAARERVRARLGIPREALVFGIVGSLAWTRSVQYCYGRELVEAMRRSSREDVRVLVVGDGAGRRRLEALAGDRLGKSVLLTGAVPREEVPQYLAAMDVASLPQSADAVGSFRYTTKLSEYLAAGLPVVTGQIPLAYDLDDGWLWRLPGDAPWDDRYIAALAGLISGLTTEQLAVRRAAVPRTPREFDRERQVTAVTAFLSDLLATDRLDAQS